MPQDNNSNEQQNLQRPANIPEGFPQYSLADLKRMPAQKLLAIAEQLNVSEGVARARTQDVHFAVAKVPHLPGGGGPLAGKPAGGPTGRRLAWPPRTRHAHTRTPSM